MCNALPLVDQCMFGVKVTPVAFPEHSLCATLNARSQLKPAGKSLAHSDCDSFPPALCPPQPMTSNAPARKPLARPIRFVFTPQALASCGPDSSGTFFGKISVIC